MVVGDVAYNLSTTQHGISTYPVTPLQTTTWTNPWPPVSIGLEMDLPMAAIGFVISWPQICPGIVSDTCGPSHQFYPTQGLTDDITNLTGAAQNIVDCSEVFLLNERRRNSGHKC